MVEIPFPTFKDILWVKSYYLGNNRHEFLNIIDRKGHRYKSYVMISEPESREFGDKDVCHTELIILLIVNWDNGEDILR